MKKLSFYLFALLALAAPMLLTSCGGDDEDGPTPAPTITIPTTGANAIPDSVAFGQQINVRATIAAAANLQRIELRLNNATLDTKTTGFTSATSDNYNFIYTVNDSALAGTTLSFRLIVTDVDGRTAQEDISVRVQRIQTIREQTAVLLGSVGSAQPSSYDVAGTGQRFNLADARANAARIDLMYYFGANNNATLVAPSDPSAASVFSGNNGPASWSTRNATRFRVVPNFSANDFNNATFGIIDATPLEPNGGTLAANLTTNQVVVFQTVDGKKGLILVENIVPGTDGTITLRLKVQD